MSEIGTVSLPTDLNWSMQGGYFRPGFFRPGEKFNFDSGTRPGFEIQPGNRFLPGKTRKYRKLKIGAHGFH